MADQSTADLQGLVRSSFCFLDVDPNNMELITQFSGISSPSMIDNSSFSNFQSYFPSDNLLFGNLESHNFPGNFSSSIKQLCNISSPDGQQISSDHESHESKNRKVVNLDAPENSSGLIKFHDPPFIKKKNGSGKGKRVKLSNEKEENSKEVGHGRGKRGQATSNHSLAEKARRGKINERLRCLQAIVPGCYKSMGTALVLDEIINYVQSLQSQVEFLSLQLTQASTFNDFNSEPDHPMKRRKI